MLLTRATEPRSREATQSLSSVSAMAIEIILATIANDPRNCSAEYRKLMDIPVNPSPPSDDATTTPQAPVPSPPLNNATTVTLQVSNPPSALSFSSFTDYERDAEIIALMHGPLPKGNDEKKGGTKRQSSKTVNQGGIAKQASSATKTLASYPLAAHTKAESSSASSHTHASSNTKLDFNKESNTPALRDRDDVALENARTLASLRGAH